MFPLQSPGWLSDGDLVVKGKEVAEERTHLSGSENQNFHYKY